MACTASVMKSSDTLHFECSKKSLNVTLVKVCKCNPKNVLEVLKVKATLLCHNSKKLDSCFNVTAGF